MQMYVLFVQGQHNARFIQSTNEGQHRGVTAIMVYVLDSRWGGWDYDLILRRTPITHVKFNHICSKQYKHTRCMFVHPEPTQQQVVYLGSKIVCEMATSCILHQTPIEHLNSNRHTAIETYVLFVQGQHDTSFIHSTNKDQHRAVIIVIVVCAFGQHVRVRFRPHTASKSNNVFKFNHARSNTNVRAIRPWHPFHILNKQKSTQTEPSSSL